MSVVLEVVDNTKTCSKCGVSKDRSEFYKAKSCKDGLSGVCNECHKSYGKRWYKTNFEKHKAGVKEWNQAHPELRRSYSKRWRKKNPNARRNLQLKSLGLSSADYNQLYKEQRGLCAISGLSETRIEHRTGIISNLAVDHDHKTKRVRSLLSFKMNALLGLANDDPVLLRAAADYLDRWKLVQEIEALHTVQSQTNDVVSSHNPRGPAPKKSWETTAVR